MVTNENMPHILLADDDVGFLDTMDLMLRRKYVVHKASSVPMAKNILRNVVIEVAVVDLHFEGQEQDGLALMDWIVREVPAVSVIVLSGDRDTARVVGAMRRDKFDFLVKSADHKTELPATLARVFEMRRTRAEENRQSVFLTRSPLMEKTLQTVDRITARSTDSPILITGESGVGKEYLAQYVAGKLRKKLVSANMSAISAELAESELFGHAHGAFTGATANKIGLVEQARNGLFFLDELGECSLAIQAKLLRVVQEHEVTPVGTTVPRKVDVRFLAATNRNLDQMVEAGAFRLDLLQRLNTFVVQIPPLRERPEDIQFFAGRFLAEFCGDTPLPIRASGMDALLAHSWPGNVRELRNVMERISILSSAGIVDGDTVREMIGASLQRCGSVVGTGKYDFMRAKILDVLEQNDGNRTKTAEILKMNPATLFRWIKRLGISGEIVPRAGRPPRVIAGIVRGEFR